MKIYREDLFPTELFIVDNVMEEEYIDSMKNDIINSMNKNDRVNWQSHPKIHTEPKYKPLVSKINEAIHFILKNKQYVYEDFIITDMWSNVLKPGESHKPHTHSNNILSGVYYVESDNKASIQFYDPRPAAGVIIPECKSYNKGNSTAWQLPSNTNGMIIFPSWLQHLVPPNTSNNLRLSIAFNIMLKGVVGLSTDYQSSEF